MATKKKTAIKKKSYISEGMVVRTYYVSKEALKAFNKKYGELVGEALRLGKRPPKQHELASALFCKAPEIDVKKWLKD